LNISSTNLTELHKTEGRLQMAFDHSAGAFVRSNRAFWWARKRCEISEKASGLAGVIPKIRARSTFWCGVGVWNHESRCWRCQCRSALRMVVIVKCGSPPQRRSREGQNPFRMGDLREMPRPGLARRGPTLARAAQTVAPVAAGGMADSPLPSQGVEACPLQIPPLTVPRIVIAHQKWLIGRSPKPQPFGRDPLEPKGDSSRSPASRWRL
jgi:hypothetical protein